MSDETIEAQVCNPETALVRTESSPPGLFGQVAPVQVIEKATEVATALKNVIVKQGLVSNISGKEYPKCEAWTLLGTMLGVFPVLAWCRKMDDGWEARVEARTKDGSVVGAAEAQCQRSERNWKDRDDFAIRSMAQTRATAKCLRMPLGFVMTLAGYEATPAEEMIADHPRTFGGAGNITAASVEGSNKQPPAPPRAATEATRKWMIDKLELCANDALAYFIDAALIMPNETLADVPLHHVPTTALALNRLIANIARYAATGELPPKAEAKEPWRTFPMPFGKNAGVNLEDLDKKYVFGLWANFEVETEYQGNPRKPEQIERDKQFRAMLDELGRHYEFTKKD